MKSTLISLLSVLLITHNGLAEEWSSEIVQEQIKNGIKQYLGESSRPAQEIQKLSKWEYEVFTIAIEDSPGKMEAALDELGEKKWDCFHIEKIFTTNAKGNRVGKLFFFCKRKPDTFLKYIPKTLLGR